MKKRILSMLFVLSPFMVPASVQAQWVVSDPGNLVQGIVNSVNEMVETSETAQNALSTWKETSKIFEQGREYYDKLRKVNDLISGSEKVKESVLMLSDISEIYVNNFGKMLTDKNFSQRELNAIAAGYNTIMKKSSRSIAEPEEYHQPHRHVHERQGTHRPGEPGIQGNDTLQGIGQLLHPQEPACILPACQGEERAATGIRPVRQG